MCQFSDMSFPNSQRDPDIFESSSSSSDSDEESFISIDGAQEVKDAQARADARVARLLAEEEKQRVCTHFISYMEKKKKTKKKFFFSIARHI